MDDSFVCLNADVVFDARVLLAALSSPRPITMIVDPEWRDETMKVIVPPLLLVTEIRTIAADALWMSPCYNTDSVALHFTWKPNWPAVSELLPRIEATLEPFGARPH